MLEKIPPDEHLAELCHYGTKKTQWKTKMLFTTKTFIQRI